MIRTKKKPFIYLPYNKKIKKKSKKKLNQNTYGNKFQPQDLMKKPKYKLNFNKNDDLYKFTGNVLSLYNIDYNSNFVKKSLDNFHYNIKEYLSIIKKDNLYLNTVGNIKQKSDILELRTIFNEYELHLLLESLDLLFTSSSYKKKKCIKIIK